MAIIDLLTLMAGLWLVASVAGMVALGALYVAERARTGGQAPGANTEPPTLNAARTDQRSDGRGRPAAVRR